MRYSMTVLLRFALCVVLLSAILPVIAQDGANLLQNGGFEGNYVAIGGDPSLQVAPNWQPWSFPPPEGSDSSAVNLRPDYQPAPANRVLSGSAAQEYNTFFATHDGGLFQRVPVSEGAELTFSVSMYIWSSATFADPDSSIQPQDVDVQVGIDPFGGQDGTSDSVIWSDPQRYYDEYRELSVSATAESTAVTVFIRSTPHGSIGVNNIYVDDASLVQTGGGSDDGGDDGNVPDPTEETIPTQDGGGENPTATPTRTPTRTSTSTTPTVTATATATINPDVLAPFPNRLTHVVAAGDTVTGLAVRYNSSVAAITAANGLNNSGLILVGQSLVIPVPAGTGTPSGTPTATPTRAGTAGPTATTVPVTGTYTVRLGETLFALAQRFNTTVEALATLNNITNPNLITAGTVLRIPGGTTNPPPTPNPGTGGPITHVVQRGENAFRIGLRYNITVEALAQANRLVNPNLVYVGQVLVIPR